MYVSSFCKKKHSEKWKTSFRFSSPLKKKKNDNLPNQNQIHYGNSLTIEDQRNYFKTSSQRGGTQGGVVGLLYGLRVVNMTKELVLKIPKTISTGGTLSYLIPPVSIHQPKTIEGQGFCTRETSLPLISSR